MDNKDSTTTSTHFVGNSCLKSQCFNSWILDSGASDHICFDKDFFHELKKPHDKEHFVVISNGKRIKVNTTRSVKLANGLTLKNVLYALGFKFNLISVNELAKDMKCKVWFYDNQCFIQGHSMMKHLVLGRAKNALYYLDPVGLNRNTDDKVKHKSFSATTINTQSIQELKIWHLRLGHLPFEKLKVLFPTNKGTHVKSLCFCTICPMAKQTRNSFSRHTIDNRLLARC